MKSGLLIALVVAVLFVLTGMAKAHDHAPPKTCEDWCSDSQCKCWDRCKGGRTTMDCLGEPACFTCTDRCDEKKDRCSTECGIEKHALRSVRP